MKILHFPTSQSAKKTDQIKMYTVLWGSFLLQTIPSLKINSNSNNFPGFQLSPEPTTSQLPNTHPLRANSSLPGKTQVEPGRSVGHKLMVIQFISQKYLEPQTTSLKWIEMVI